ncbi:unnamed protein product [Cuscuta epithymum]|uniref:Uncharacterized protein n=1 Tax=Cuscuta epithymum TaxID=186058 RepID=A0AAV0CSN1_9ASTE|nr:unnamed protein product [Cuscuta epithymum]
MYTIKVVDGDGDVACPGWLALDHKFFITDALNALLPNLCLLANYPGATCQKLIRNTPGSLFKNFVTRGPSCAGSAARVWSLSQTFLIHFLAEVLGKSRAGLISPTLRITL